MAGIKIPVSACFIGARGVVDMILEVVQLLGYRSMGRAGDYVHGGNIYDVFRCVVPILFINNSESRILHMMVIFIYWMRLLRAFTISDKIMTVLVPIINSSLDLGPPVGVATMLFLGMTHILYTIRSEDVPFFSNLAQHQPTRLHRH